MTGDLLRTAWQTVCGDRARGLQPPDERGAALQVSEDDRALLDLKAQRDQLAGHQRRMERLAEKSRTAAASFLKAGNKQRAMLALRKKRQHEELSVECAGHVAKVEELILGVETACLQRDTVEALKLGVATIRKVQVEMGGVDQVQRLLDDHADAAEAQKEISEALAAAGIAEDDPEALGEYERLRKELAGVGSVSGLAECMAQEAGAEQVVLPDAADAVAEPAATADVSKLAKPEQQPCPARVLAAA